MKNGWFSSKGFSKHERAFLIESESATPHVLEFDLAASENYPVVNPAFVIRNWGEGEVRLKIDGVPVPRGKGFRTGRRFTDKGTDLIVWLKNQSIKPVRISMKTEGSNE
jgi:hypothetical protein